MTEVLFYQLQRQPIERVLPPLLERSLERGWRVVVQVATDERVEALDAHLWTYREDGFLAHGTYRESEAAAQPVLLTVHDHNPNAANVRFLIDGAGCPGGCERLPAHRAAVRRRGRGGARRGAHAHWAEAKAKGFEVTYWQADENGRWEKKA